METTDRHFVLRLNEQKISVIKSLINKRVSQLDSDSLLTKNTEDKEHILKEALLLMNILNDINNVIEEKDEGKKPTTKPPVTFCYHCLEETTSFIENDIIFCEKCGSSK